MAKAKPKARPQPSAPPAAAAAPEPAVVPDEPASRRTLLTTAAVVAACLAGTILLLSGWTPGPGVPAQPRIAASAPAKTAPPKKKATTKPSTVQQAPKTRKRVRPAPPTARQVAEELFVGECGICHTLAAAGTTGVAGPNLDKLKPPRLRVLDAIAAGGRRTGLMPPGILTGSEALNVAKFVAEASRR
jgi:mono/diheme cytochrome c family protein